MKKNNVAHLLPWHVRYHSTVAVWCKSRVAPSSCRVCTALPTPAKSSLYSAIWVAVFGAGVSQHVSVYFKRGAKS